MCQLACNSDEWQIHLCKLSVQNEVLCYSDDNILKKVIPKQLVSLILKVPHDLPLYGHRDFEKTRLNYFYDNFVTRDIIIKELKYNNVTE